MASWMKLAGIVGAVMVMTLGTFELSNIAQAEVPGVNQRISMSSTGAQTVDSSGFPHISANGKFVVFRSNDSYILPTGGKGVFVRNLSTGTTTRVNESSNGAVSDETNYTNPEKISATGRYVLFRSRASNLIDGVSIPVVNDQLYLRDTVLSKTTLISQTLSGTISNGNALSAVGVSSDGRFVSYVSNASNLHPDSSDGTSHIYMLDRVNNSLSILDRYSANGSVGVVSGSIRLVGSMSCDGSLIVFHHPADLVPAPATTRLGVYLLDRRGETDKLIRVTDNANQASSAPDISCNGDFISFVSDATNLDTSISFTGSSSVYRPYVYDRVNDKFHLVTVTASGSPSNKAICGSQPSGYSQRQCARLSDIGVVAFNGNDSSLTGVEGNQTYLRDIYRNVTEIISKNSNGIPSAPVSSYGMGPHISSDGSIVTYNSEATNLVSGDTNGMSDIFTSLTGY